MLGVFERHGVALIARKTALILTVRSPFGTISELNAIFPNSSTAEQSAVNRSVVGSNPTSGAMYKVKIGTINQNDSAILFYELCHKRPGVILPRIAG